MIFRNCFMERPTPLEIVLEPWGMPLELPHGSVMEVLLYGAEGPPELDLTEHGITLYCASGSRIAVLVDGVEAYSTLDCKAVPATPKSMTVRTFVQKLFGG